MQRDIAAPIWGWGAPGERIGVTVGGKPAGDAVVGGNDGGRCTRGGPSRAGGPHTIVVAGTNRSQTIGNVLFGDVWLCSGQSNMNWPVRLSDNAEQEIKEANDPELRSFTVS